MTPAERAKWCIEQAEDIERSLPPGAADEELKPIGYCAAQWWRDMAFHVAGQDGVGHA